MKKNKAWSNEHFLIWYMFCLNYEMFLGVSARKIDVVDAMMTVFVDVSASSRTRLDLLILLPTYLNWNNSWGCTDI